MWFPSLRTSAAAAALVAAVSALPKPQQGGGGGGNACNNSPSLCSRKYNEVTYLGAHNSYALRDDSTDDSLSGNQYLNATVALDAGLRLLQAQTHQGNTTLQLCHTSCDLLDAGPLEDWLAKINTWMDANPNEVVTVIVVNGDTAPASEFNRALEASGIGQKAYTPTTAGNTGEWPTLRKMIDDNQRFVFFATEVEATQQAPAVLSEFDYVFETPFEVTELTGFNCTVDRPSSLSDGASAISSNYMGLVNHFKYQSLGGIQLPDVDTIGTVNSAATSQDGNLGKHLQQCNQQWSSRPSFVLIDFWDEANPIAAADAMNQVEDATGRVEPQGGGGSSAAGRVGAGKMEYGALVAFFSAVVLLV